MRGPRWIALAVGGSLGVGLNGCVSMATIDAARGQPNLFTPRTKKASNLRPNAAYYALLPLTLPADVVATPVIVVMLQNQDWAP